MSLNTENFRTDLLAVFRNEQTEETDYNASLNRIVNGIVAATEAFIKTGTVQVNVNTTGTAAAQTGTGTGNIT